MGKNLKKKTILVSGGGGSIGSELCRQIARLGPKQLIIVDNSEYNLYLIDMELRKRFADCDIHSLLLNITDNAGIRHAFATYQPDIVFHAAAYKHVPLLEKQARVAIYNNVMGTHNLANAAVEYNVSKFLLISTDKAVNPANLMGATKRAAEMICQNLHEQSTTSFITVRFGNVLDSAGSVVPLFRKQIQEGGPVTVTHPEITRYFMSIPEASQLILQAGFMGSGGEIFVLDMGEPIKICYLAEQMIKLSGKKLGQDIEISYTGLRPGEKLYEELFYANEELQPTIHNKIMLGNATKVNDRLLSQALHTMEKAYHNNDESLLYDLIKQIVPEYHLDREAKPLPKQEKIQLVANASASFYTAALAEIPVT
jgi:FlaA1/EpsC-like NDP-sugar epimerase